MNITTIINALKQFIVAFTPKTMPQTPENAPQSGAITVTQFCKALEVLEGYFPPCGEFPSGSPAWQHKNPGNLRCPPLHAGAIKCVNNFNVFPDYATGFKAQEDNIIAILEGKAVQYGYYPAMTLYQFFLHRDPASDGNNPLSCATNVATQLGVTINYQLSNLLIQ